MTRAQQIDTALKVLAPPRYKRKHCRSNIEYMLDDVQAFSGTSAELRATRSKRTARAWRSYHLAVVRLRATHIALLATGWGGFIELADIERAIQKTTPEECDVRRRAQEMWASLGGLEQKRAVENAYDLLTQWRGDEKLVTTRRGKWWRLAAILYGEPDADLFRYLRTFAKYGGVKKMSARI